MIRLQPHHQSLVEGAMGLVGKVIQAKRGNWWVQACDSWDDAYQAGLLGLCAASVWWESPRGFAFSTYAFPWIWRAIQRDVCTAGRWLVVATTRSMTGWRYELRYRLAGHCHYEGERAVGALASAEASPVVSAAEECEWHEYVERRFLRVATWLQRERVAQLWLDGQPIQQIAKEVGLSKQGAYDVLRRVFDRTRAELEREGAA